MATTKIARATRRAFAVHLLAWYEANQRDLPWRRDASDPYRVWIAEILLQQTQVVTAIPYYERFLARFPNVRALASARLDDVLKAWEGAGYYARARNLQRAAQEIVARFDGTIPSTVTELRALPGIGRYTAGAIASIAFHREAAAVDGNAMRVLCRVFAIRHAPRRARTQTELWQLAESLLPRGRAGEFNQALMELGATVCAPRQPACDVCPLARACAARRLGLQAKLPAKTAQRQLPHHHVAIGVIWKGKRLLIARRRDNQLLGGLWEFPGGHRKRGETLAACVAREVREELGIEIAVGEEWATRRHAYSHFRITLHAFDCRWVRGRPRALGCAAWRWVVPDELTQYAFPAANRQLIAKLTQPKSHATR